MNRIEIRYCVMWNYRPRAVRVAEILQDRFDELTTLTEGGRGEFTVWVDGKEVAHKVGDIFPEDEDVAVAVSKALGS